MIILTGDWNRARSQKYHLQLFFLIFAQHSHWPPCFLLIQTHHSPASKPLHFFLSLLGKFFPQTFAWLSSSFHSDHYLNITSQRGPSRSIQLKYKRPTSTCILVCPSTLLCLHSTYRYVTLYCVSICLCKCIVCLPHWRNCNEIPCVQVLVLFTDVSLVSTTEPGTQKVPNESFLDDE